MNKDLQELIDTAKTLSRHLEEFALAERIQCEELENEFEKMSWDVFRMAEDMRLIQQFKELQLQVG